MTNIESLAELRIAIGVGPDEDFVLALPPFVDASKNPLYLDGIAFVATISLDGTTVATVTGVVSGYILTFRILAAAKTGWPVANLAITILATALNDDGSTRAKDILASGSIVASGASSPLVLTTILGSVSGIGAVSAQTAANTEASALLTSGPISVTGTFWQATQPVSLASLPALAAGSNVIGAVTQSGTWSAGRTWSLSSGSDSVTATISGTVSVTGTFWQAVQPVSDSQSAAYSGVVAMTVGATYAVGRSVGVLATSSGKVTFQFSDASTLTLPVSTGWQTFPFACTAILSAGTTATATYYNMK